MTLQKWQLISTKDISPSEWFPLESRTYRLPNGQIIEDFTVTTLADVAMMVAVTKEGKVVLVHQYKPGVDEIMYQFPAGRKEPTHQDTRQTAAHELEEEVGIKMEESSFVHFATLSAFSTKGSEQVYFYFVEACEFNSKQQLDSTENIEIVTVSPQELDTMVEDGTIRCAQTIAGWELAKKKFPQLNSR